MKLLSFNRHRDPILVPVKMNGIEFAWLDLYTIWNPYIQSIDKADSRMLQGRSLTYEAILYHYKSPIWPCMEYCSHIWGGAPRSHGLDLQDRMQKRVVSLVGSRLSAGLQVLSHSLSLFYKYYYGKCNSELADLVPHKGVTVIVRSTGFSKKMLHHTVNSPMCRTKFYQPSFSFSLAALWNSPTNECFPPDYDLTAFKGRANNFLLLK